MKVANYDNKGKYRKGYLSNHSIVNNFVLKRIIKF
jgi:hypothetical protein